MFQVDPLDLTSNRFFMGIGYFAFICPYWEGQINLMFLMAGSAGAAIAAQRTQSAPEKRQLRHSIAGERVQSQAMQFNMEGGLLSLQKDTFFISHSITIPLINVICRNSEKIVQFGPSRQTDALRKCLHFPFQYKALYFKVFL